MLLYAITSRILLAPTELERESEQLERLVDLAARWGSAGADFIQIRERDLNGVDLARLAARMVDAIRSVEGKTRVLLHGGSSPYQAARIALDAGAAGVHLPGGTDAKGLTAALDSLREIWAASSGAPLVSVSCHSAAEVAVARSAGADLALFAPVFEKALPEAPAMTGQGLEALSHACRTARQNAGNLPPIRVFALGGVTAQNAAECIAAGADGIAAIRLFLDPEPTWRNLARL
jgi:thiamine-phosphate pyrophosphorylase